jgi:hypothetical protein
MRAPRVDAQRTPLLTSRTRKSNPASVTSIIELGAGIKSP